MTSKKTESTLPPEGPQEAVDAPAPSRRPWVAPTLQQLDLRETMAGISPTGPTDGTSTS